MARMPTAAIRRRKKKAPPGLKEITQEELNEKLATHKKWVLTKGKAGEKEDFTGYNFKGLSFRFSFLNEADFRGSWLEDTDFSHARCIGVNFEKCWVEGSRSDRTIFTGSNISGTIWAKP